MEANNIQTHNILTPRDALNEIEKRLDRILARTELGSELHSIALDAHNIADAALAEQPRICDVLGEEAMINIVKSEIGARVPMATDLERKIAEIAATAALATAYATAPIQESEVKK